jgi:hypothetical protein
MRESAEQIPHFTQTAMGGKRMAIKPRKISDVHMLIVVFALFIGLIEKEPVYV